MAASLSLPISQLTSHRWDPRSQLGRRSVLGDDYCPVSSPPRNNGFVTPFLQCRLSGRGMKLCWRTAYGLKYWKKLDCSIFRQEGRIFFRLCVLVRKKGRCSGVLSRGGLLRRPLMYVFYGEREDWRLLEDVVWLYLLSCLPRFLRRPLLGLLCRFLGWWLRCFWTFWRFCVRASEHQSVDSFMRWLPESEFLYFWSIVSSCES